MESEHTKVQIPHAVATPPKNNTKEQQPPNAGNCIILAEFIKNNTHTMQETLKQYRAMVALCKNLFANKMADYGSAWRILRLPSLTDQIFIKAQRTRSLQQNHVSKVNEDQAEGFIAIVNYSLMALIQLEKGVAEQPDTSKEEALALYHKHMAHIEQLMQNKNHDYGEAWRDMRVSSITDLILQKILRIKQIENNAGKTLVSEGVAANYQDMVNYALFALIHLKSKT